MKRDAKKSVAAKRKKAAPRAPRPGSIGSAAACEAVIETLVSMLKKNGVASYEIFYSHDTGFGVEVQKGEIDAMKARSGSGVGLRVITDGSQGFGFSSVLSTDALSSLVEKTVSASRHTSKDEFLKFALKGRPNCDERSLEIFDRSIGSVGEDEKIKCAIILERSAMSASSKVKRVRKASYSESTYFSRLVNSNGVDAAHSATYFSGSVTAVCEDKGDSQMGWEIGMGHRRKDVDPEIVGRGAADNALRMLGARKIKTVKCGAVIENTVVCELMEPLVSSFLADNVHKGKSMLAGKLGKAVASKAVCLYDDATLKRGWASSVYDAEGAPCQKTPLLVDGVAQNYLYDTYWALRDGVKSTGSSVRSGYKGMPTLGISNVYIEKGKKRLDVLLKELGTGLFITDVLGVHTINSVSGEFSLGASGLWVEAGKLSYPVRGLAISGNLLELFSKVGETGADMRFIGSIGAPSILVEGLEASGT